VGKWVDALGGSQCLRRGEVRGWRSGGLWKDGMRYVVLILNIVNLCAFDYV